MPAEGGAAGMREIKEFAHNVPLEMFFLLLQKYQTHKTAERDVQWTVTNPIPDTTAVKILSYLFY